MYKVHGKYRYDRDGYLDGYRYFCLGIEELACCAARVGRGKELAKLPVHGGCPEPASARSAGYQLVGQLVSGYSMPCKSGTFGLLSVE